MANLIIPERAIEIATAEKPGVVTDLDLERKRNRWVYEVEIVDAAGIEWEFKIDARRRQDPEGQARLVLTFHASLRPASAALITKGHGGNQATIERRQRTDGTRRSIRQGHLHVEGIFTFFPPSCGSLFSLRDPSCFTLLRPVTDRLVQSQRSSRT
jgi:hypothetical protein